MAHTDDSMKSPPRPRIVQPREPEGAMAAADKQDDYTFFAFPPSERTDAVKKKIEEREKSLFELEMIQAMLDGNPSLGAHKDAAAMGGQPCNCGACELVRVNSAIEGLVYGLQKLRALHARMVG